MFIQTRKKNKRAVSVMIGYILLITFAVVIAGFVYSWLKTYVPKEGVNCPDGVSMYVSSYKVENGILNLNIRNSGKFSIGGAYIYYTSDSAKDIPDLDLSTLITNGGLKINPGVKFLGESKNSFSSNSDDISLSFDVSNVPFIYKIQLTPIRYQEEGTKTQTVSCTEAKTTKILDLDTTIDTAEIVTDNPPTNNQQTNPNPPTSQTSSGEGLGKASTTG